MPTARRATSHVPCEHAPATRDPERITPPFRAQVDQLRQADLESLVKKQKETSAGVMQPIHAGIGSTARLRVKESATKKAAAKRKPMGLGRRVSLAARRASCGRLMRTAQPPRVHDAGAAVGQGGLKSGELAALALHGGGGFNTVDLAAPALVGPRPEHRISVTIGPLVEPRAGALVEPLGSAAGDGALATAEHAPDLDEHRAADGLVCEELAITPRGGRDGPSPRGAPATSSTSLSRRKERKVSVAIDDDGPEARPSTGR